MTDPQHRPRSAWGPDRNGTYGTRCACGAPFLADTATEAANLIAQHLDDHTDDLDASVASIDARIRMRAI